VDKNVTNATGHFRADRDASMAGGSADVSNDDVLGGFADALAVFVHATLERDAVFAALNVAVFDDQIAAGIDDDAIVVRTVGRVDLKPANDDTVAIGKMDRPERPAFADGEIFHQHIRAVNGQNELRAKGKVFGSALALADG